MLLKRLEVRNFRSYHWDKGEGIRFESGINAIVGKNNAGKSAILQALNYLKGGISETRENRFAGNPTDGSYVELTVKFDTSEIRTFLSPILSTLSNIEEILRFQSKNFPDITYTRHSGNGETKLGPLRVVAGAIFDDYVEGQKNETTKTWAVEDGVQLKHVDFVDVIIDMLKHGRARVNSYIGFQYDLAGSLWGILNNHLVVFPEYRSRPGGGDTRTLASLDGLQVASVLNTLKNGNSEEIRTWRRIVNEFSEFYPSLILDVRRAPGQNPQVWIEKRDIDYDVTIDRVGAGISEFVVFLTHLIDSSEMIFCLDSSEIHFHPHAQRKLLSLINSYSKRNQFVLVTHSPYLIEPSSVSNLSIVREENGRSRIYQPKSRFSRREIQKLSRIMTPQFKEVFFSDFVLMVEGPTETGALPILAKSMGKDFDELNVSIIEVGKYLDVPLKLCLGFSLPFLVMCDKDAMMNVETHFGRGEARVECSPIVRTMLLNGWLPKSVERLVRNPNNIDLLELRDGQKKRYSEDLFKLLRGNALRKGIYVLSSRFETILKRAGYTHYFEEIEEQGVRSKPIIGKYVAGEIIENRDPIPQQFTEVLNRIPE